MADARNYRARSRTSIESAKPSARQKRWPSVLSRATVHRDAPRGRARASQRERRVGERASDAARGALLAHEERLDLAARGLGEERRAAQHAHGARSRASVAAALGDEEQRASGSRASSARCARSAPSGARAGAKRGPAPAWCASEQRPERGDAVELALRRRAARCARHGLERAATDRALALSSQSCSRRSPQRLLPSSTKRRSSSAARFVSSASRLRASASLSTCGAVPHRARRGAARRSSLAFVETAPPRATAPRCGPPGRVTRPGVAWR